MPAFATKAPGKIILLGEHAVVYHRPAIAIPVTQVAAHASVTANPLGQPGMVRIEAPDIALSCHLHELSDLHPLATAVNSVAEALGIQSIPACTLRITSTIPIASGLGSGAAVSVAIARSLSAFLGHPLEDDQVSNIAYRVDQIYHGAPSGVDNTVIAYAQPVFFIRGQPFQRLCTHEKFTMVIGDTGIGTPTGEVVMDLRRRWQAQPAGYEPMFDQIGAIVQQARTLLEDGPIQQLGPLMTQNHSLLQQMDISCPELDALVNAALSAGASGAKLCGGGRGGNMIALAGEAPDSPERIAAALRMAGAVNTIITHVGNA
jgi:mevalonate kinase